MSNITFRIAAKTDVGCIRTNNEDNFQAAADLSQAPMRWINNQSYDLGPKGALLVVADGMGGMNAGEVASEIAINTIKEYFAPERLTPEVTKTRFTIEKYMRDVVVEADRRIKAASTVETKGMGTTVVMAWLFDGQCYVCWCGDSRAYIYNPVNGLFQISKDHSYVQGLVDEGKISEEDAFDFPDSNIITRCLCDAKAKAEPDVLAQPQPLCNGDIILLCSDGLSGMLRDRDMQQIIKAHTDNMDVCVDELIGAALRAGGNDNVTVAVASIESGGATATPARVPAKTIHKRSATVVPGGTATKAAAGSRKAIPAWLWGLGGIVVAAGIFTGVYFGVLKHDEPQPADTNLTDQPQPDVNTEDSKGYKTDNTQEFENVVATDKDKDRPATTRPAPFTPANNAKKNGNTNAIAYTNNQDTAKHNKLQLVGTIDPDFNPIEDNTDNTTSDVEIYVVQKGDTLTKLSKKFGGFDVLKRLNPELKKDQELKIGDKLTVPKTK